MVVFILAAAGAFALCVLLGRAPDHVKKRLSENAHALRLVLFTVLLVVVLTVLFGVAASPRGFGAFLLGLAIVSLVSSAGSLLNVLPTEPERSARSTEQDHLAERTHQAGPLWFLWFWLPMEPHEAAKRPALHSVKFGWLQTHKYLVLLLFLIPLLVVFFLFPLAFAGYRSAARAITIFTCFTGGIIAGGLYALPKQLNAQELEWL
jgi:hypothetical protein